MNLVTQINKFFMIWMCKSIRLVDQSTEDADKLKMEIKINDTRSWSVLCLLTTNSAIQNNWFSMHPATRSSYFI